MVGWLVGFGLVGLVDFFVPGSDRVFADVANEALFMPLAGLVFHLLHAFNDKRISCR
jgi:hypothetical protein